MTMTAVPNAVWPGVNEHLAAMPPLAGNDVEATILERTRRKRSLVLSLASGNGLVAEKPNRFFRQASVERGVAEQTRAHSQRIRHVLPTVAPGVEQSSSV